jgi:hypothetical protein
MGTTISMPMFGGGGYSGSGSGSGSGSNSSQSGSGAPIVEKQNTSIGIQRVKAGTIKVSIGNTTGADTVITFPDGSKATTASPSPPDPMPNPLPSGFGGPGQKGYSLISLFSISITDDSNAKK